MTLPAQKAQSQNQPNQPIVAKTQASPYTSWRISERNLITNLLVMGSLGKGHEVYTQAVDDSGLEITDFYERQLQGIWTVAGMLYAEGKEITLQTIWAKIQEGVNDNSHVLDLLAYLANQPADLAHKTHAKSIVEASIDNMIKMSVQKLQPLMSSSATPIETKIQKLYGIVSEVKTRLEHKTQTETLSVADGFEMTIKDLNDPNIEPNIGIVTGFQELDRKYNGWGKETLNYVVAPTGAGKSVFLMTSALHATMAKKRVLFVQLEMPTNQTLQRLICAFGGINSNRLKRKTLAPWEQERILQVMQKMNEFDKDRYFKLIYSKQPTLDDLEIKLDTMMLKGYDIIFLDYAGGTRFSPGKTQNSLDLHDQIYNRINQWKFRYKVPIVAGAQYNFDFPQKHEGAYTNKMIYSSQSASFNADTVMFIHPPTPKTNKKKEEEEIVDKTRSSLVLTKIRDGEKSAGNDIIHVRNQFDMHRFAPMSVSTSTPMWDLRYDIKTALNPDTIDLRDL